MAPCLTLKLSLSAGIGGLGEPCQTLLTFRLGGSNLSRQVGCIGFFRALVGSGGVASRFSNNLFNIFRCLEPDNIGFVGCRRCRGGVVGKRGGMDGIRDDFSASLTAFGIGVEDLFKVRHGKVKWDIMGK